MKKLLLFAITTCVSLIMQQQASAAILITNFNLGTNNLSFDISGTLPNTLPTNSRNYLYFVNSNPAANPGFALGNFYYANSKAFDGAQGLGNVFTGNPYYGDYLLVGFSNTLSTGEEVSGTVTATWSSQAFDPSEVSLLNVFWGSDESLPADPSKDPCAVTGGTFLTSIAVPEPSTFLLVATFGAGLLLCRRGRNL